MKRDDFVAHAVNPRNQISMHLYGLRKLLEVLQLVNHNHFYE